MLKGAWRVGLAVVLVAGALGVLIGVLAGATVIPYVLHLLEAAQTGAPLRSREELLQQMRPYVESQLQAGLALKHITRHLLGLYHGQPGGRGFRKVLSEGAHRPGADWALVEQAVQVTRDQAERAA